MMMLRTKERGAVTTEFAVIAAVIMASFLMLMLYAGRVAQAENDVRSAAHEAARAATLVGTPDQAQSTARRTALANLTESGMACANGTNITVDTSSWGPGGWVTVTVTCHASFADVASLAVPATQTFTASASEVIDVHRGN